MKAVERQRKLLGILYEKGHETMKNLAEILNVSERTIRRDVEFLSLSEPISVCSTISQNNQPNK